MPALHAVPWRTCAYVLLALLPLGFVVSEIGQWIRNIPRWDEFDTVLDFLIALDSGATFPQILQRLFAVQNEHRMVVSRLLFASSYWFFDGINFATLAVIGNLFLAGTFASLVLAVKTPAARLRCAAVLALCLFQLQHHENFFWGGSSIDHFFVVLAVVGALAAASRPGRAAVALGCACAFLATFSLAHGILVWPIGFALLALERRWRAVAGWSAAALAAGALFLLGFQVNPGHHMPTAHDLWNVARYWLMLIGGSAALDHADLAPWLGGVFLVAVALVARRAWAAGDRLKLATMAWTLGAMAMIAWGRALLSPPWAPITSRYMILSSLAWGLLGCIALERFVVPSRWSARGLPLVFGALLAFNVSADLAHLADGRALARASEIAARSYYRNGTLAKSITKLYPDDARADALLAQARRRGLYQLPPPSRLRLPLSPSLALHAPLEIDDAVFCIDELETTAGETHVRGWAFRPDHTMHRGEVAVVFRSAEGLFAFEPLPRLRPDVAQAFERWDAAYAGFDLRLPAAKLPPGKFVIGVCFTSLGEPEYMMTEKTVTIPKS